jgi:hypothetical protein
MLKKWILALEKSLDIKVERGVYGFDWFDYSWEAIAGRRRLISHSQVRDKTDMHPQPELIAMLNSL